MTYYEELGVSATASVDEIRQAYRRLAQLLHPDKLQDERARGVAECQMKRLNGILQVLVHDNSRGTYDASLLEQPSGAKRNLRGPVGLYAGGAIVGLAMVWAVAQDGSSKRRPEPRTEQAVAAPRQEPKREAAPLRRTEPDVRALELRRRYEAMRAERDAALEQVEALKNRIEQLRAQQASTLPAAPVHMAAAEMTPPPDAAVNGQHADTRPHIAGTWLYLPPRQKPTSPELYPPEFIETLIVEEEGKLHGRYRARYRVRDRAISPEVAFQFSGRAEQDAARLPWVGAGGARGEVRLRLLSENRLEVAWVAQELGTALGLGSGRAVLVRRQEP
ncbi:MAG: J domain-containing protein [Acidobacteria bacterium]|nr:J domain-containing protein [Acidobacteriota bacterium]